MSIRYAFHHGELPELTLTDDELAQAGDWLTQSDFLVQSFNIEGQPSRITTRAEQGTMLA